MNNNAAEEQMQDNKIHELKMKLKVILVFVHLCVCAHTVST